MMEMMEVPEPVLQNPGDVKVKLVALGICGSDVHYYTRGRIGSQIVSYPFAVGHECAGVVTETGHHVTRIKEGEMVAVDPSIWCGRCDQCLSGRHHTCRNIRFLGCPGQAEGALSEFIILPETSCFPLPEKLTADHGAISEPLSIGIYSVKKAGDLSGKKIAVLGFGPIGMSVTLAAKAAGAGSLFVTDKIDERLAVARKEKAAFTGNPAKEDIVKKIKDFLPLGVDVVFECCGQQEAVDQAVEILKPGGSIIIVGIPETDRWSLSVDDTRRKELSVQFIRRQVNCTATALDMMNNGTIDISNMVTHRFPFERTKEAFVLVEGYCEGVMKAMIDF